MNINPGDNIYVTVKYYTGWHFMHTRRRKTLTTKTYYVQVVDMSDEGIIVRFTECVLFSYGNGITVGYHFFRLNPDGTISYFAHNPDNSNIITLNDLLNSTTPSTEECPHIDTKYTIKNSSGCRYNLSVEEFKHKLSKGECILHSWSSNIPTYEMYTKRQMLEKIVNIISDNS